MASAYSSDVEEVTIDPNSQWKPVPVKQEPKEEECQGPQLKKSRPSPPDSLSLTGGVRTPNSQLSSGNGHYSPYQTQPPSVPGVGVPTPPGRTPEALNTSGGGGGGQEHSSSQGNSQSTSNSSGE